MVMGLLICLAAFATATPAQIFPTPDYFRKMHYTAPQQLPPPEGLQERVVDGKLRLSLADTIQLVLLNNTDVQLNRLSHVTSQYPILRAYSTFDPVFTASFNTNRSTSPTTSQLEGAATLSTLNQNTSTNWSQTFPTGTRYQISFSGNKNTTNSQFSNFNPSIGATLSFNLSQPLLRSRWLFANRAPIVIAQRSQKQSRANFEAQVSDSVRAAIDQYWTVVESRENLKVLRKSLELAEATYARNKRELELGALPPLDIYRSESQVATRRVQVIQAEYNLKQLEDAFRRTIGADLDPMIRVLDLELTETPDTAGELLAMDSAEALKQAMARRPELEAQRLQLQNDDTNVRLAHNNMQPDLTFSTFYNATGRGGNRINTSTTPPTIISQGGLIEALEQISSFDFPGYGFTLSLRLPVRNRGAAADLGTARVNQQRSLYTMRQREQSITLEVRNAVHQLEQAKLSMAASRIARDLAQKNLDAEQRKYELGVQTIFFVLDAQTQLATAEQDLLRSQINYRRSVTALDRAIGALLDRNNIRIQ
jgi:outer membrane protein TolC